MVVGDKHKHVVVVLEFEHRFDGTEVVADMQSAGRLEAVEYAHDGFLRIFCAIIAGELGIRN